MKLNKMQARVLAKVQENPGICFGRTSSRKVAAARHLRVVGLLEWRNSEPSHPTWGGWYLTPAGKAQAEEVTG